MGKKKPLEISSILDEASKYFGVSVEDVCNPSLSAKPSQELSNARLLTVFMAAKAGYSNAEIAHALNYKSDAAISTKFNKAQKTFALPKSEEEVVFWKACNSISKILHFSLE